MTMLLSLAIAAQLPILDLNCTLQPDQSRMQISATVTLVPASSDTSKATFFLSDRMEVPKVRVLSPETLKGDVVPKNLSVRDHDVTYEVQLPKPLAKGESLKLGFDYSSKESKGFVYMVGPKACLAGGYNTCWFPSVGDSRRMLGNMQFKSPEGFLVKASAKELSAREEGGIRTSRFEILQPTVPTFAAARYKVTHVEGTVPMTLYLLKDRPVAKAFTEGCSKILAVLTKEFGKYPFPDFSIIETPAESSTELGFSGASFEGFMFADSDSVDSGFNTAYFGHELGHQWWGNLVQMRGVKGNYMLSEAMAQYGSLQCVTEIDGPLLATRYRMIGYPQYSPLQSGLGALAYTATSADKPLSHLPDGYDVVYHQFANSKGFLVWDTLARQVGREKFRKALHTVTSKYAWTSVTFDEFLSELRAAAGQNIDGVISQWFDRTGAPVVWSDWKQDKGTVSVTLHQSEPLYSLSLPIVVTFADGSSISKEIAFSTAEQTQSLPAKQRIAKVEVDPNHLVFHSTPDLQQKVKDFRFVTEATFARFRNNEKLAIETLQKGLAQAPSQDTYGATFFMHLGLATMYRNQKRFLEAKDQTELALKCPVRDEVALPYLYFNYAKVLTELGDKIGAEAALKSAETADAALPYSTGVSVDIAVFRTTLGK